MRYPLLLAGLALALSTPAFAQPAPTMVKIATGSELATWTFSAATKTARKTPIIFLHGGPGLYTEARRFDEGKPLRDAGFTTIYFDQAGGGKSARLKVADYNIDRAVADVDALRAALGHDKVVLWGNSYGASLAAVYADRHPDRVAGILMTAPGMFPGYSGNRDYSGTNRDKVVYSKALTKAVSLIDGKGAAAEASLSQADSGVLFDELVKSELIEGVVCKGSSVVPPALPGGGNLYAQRLLSQGIKTLKFAPKPAAPRPVLIVRGACDYLPLASAEKYRTMLGGRIEVIANSGHGLLENKSAYETALTRFAVEDLKAVP